MFHYFAQLPAELRLAIWRECLPHRVVEIDITRTEMKFSYFDKPPCELKRTTQLNSRPPVLSQVCHESRIVALESGFYVSSKQSPPEACWQSDTKINAWLDPSRDSIHLNWLPKDRRQANSKGSALHHLAWMATGCQGASFMFAYLDHIVNLDFNRKPMISALRQLSQCRVVISVMVVHAAHETAAKSGLFGLLGDEYIQLVDLSDQSRLEAFTNFSKHCEAEGHITTKQRRFYPGASLTKEYLNDKILELFGSDANLPPMYPAIMFRFCPDMCNRTAS